MNIVPAKVGHGTGKEANYQLCYNTLEPTFRSRGKYLPHWYQPGKLQFITIRLNDSLPQSKLEELEELKEKILTGIIKYTPDKINYPLQKILSWLDQGYGECILQYDEIQRIVDEAIVYYDGIAYDLYDYVIMPNHIHLLILPYKEPTQIVGNLKRFTDIKIKELLGRKDYKVWQEDYFDRIVRGMNDFYEIVEYIKENPKSKYK